MDVYTINQTLESVKVLRKKFGAESPQVFALTWIAWEQLGFRVFKVSAKLDGWNLNLVTKVLNLNSKSRKPHTAEKLIEKLTKVRPENFAGSAGEIWKEINSHRALRNRFVHGSSRTRPGDYENAFDFMFPLVEDVSWLSSVRLLHIENRPLLGNVYRDLRNQPRINSRVQNLENLKERLSISC